MHDTETQNSSEQERRCMERLTPPPGLIAILKPDPVLMAEIIDIHTGGIALHYEAPGPCADRYRTISLMNSNLDRVEDVPMEVITDERFSGLSTTPGYCCCPSYRAGIRLAPSDAQKEKICELIG